MSLESHPTGLSANHARRVIEVVSPPMSRCAFHARGVMEVDSSPMHGFETHARTEIKWTHSLQNRLCFMRAESLK